MFTSAIRTYNEADNMLRNQLIGYVGGIVIAVVFSVIDYRDYRVAGFGIYAVGVALLLLLFSPLRTEIGGAVRWIKIPGFTTIQPSEFAKTGLVIVSAFFMERIKLKRGNILINLALLSAFAGIPTGLVLLHDFGTFMVMALILLIMAFVCGLKFRFIFIGVGVVVLSTPFLWFFVLKDFQRGRILSFITPEAYADSYAYNVIRSRIAFGSGGFTGKGIYNGDLTASRFVPVQESDFIFSVIGEELGFLGAAILLLYIMFLALWLVWIAKAAEDSFGSLVVTGLSSMMIIHFVENIGASIGLLPVTGIPLPFISQGASALITNFMSVGVMLSVSAKRKRNYFKPKKGSKYAEEEN